jgi:hypothetical protein
VEKLDLSKQDKVYYKTGKEPVLIELGPTPYLTIEGKGKPGGEAFQDVFGALYGVAFTTKFAYKAKGQDFSVAKIEGLYWRPGEAGVVGGVAKEEMRWKLMIRLPDFVQESAVEDAKRQAIAKRGPGLIPQVRFETIDEGKCAQIMHIGPYDKEEPTIARLNAFIKEQGLAPHGRHHEIYLSDPRRVAPEKLKTIIRQPVR